MNHVGCGTSRHGAVIRGAVVAALGGFLLGFDTVVISGANDALQKVFGLNSFSLGFTVAMAMIGTIAGAVVIGKPADVFGRRKALFALAVCYFVSAIGSAWQDWWEFLAARFVGGLAIGGASVVSPMYIAEISPPHLRGRLVTVSQLNLVVGILLCYVSNYVVAQYLEFDVAWRWMLGLAAFPSVVFFLLIFGIPESPRWLVKVGRPATQEGQSERLGVEDVDRELDAIQASLADGGARAGSGSFSGRIYVRCCWRRRWPCSISSPASMPFSITPRRFSAWLAPPAIRPCSSPSPLAERFCCSRLPPCSSSTASAAAF